MAGLEFCSGILLHMSHSTLLRQAARILVPFAPVRQSVSRPFVGDLQIAFQNFHRFLSRFFGQGTVHAHCCLFEHGFLAITRLVLACSDVFHEIFKTLLRFITVFFVLRNRWASSFAGFLLSSYQFVSCRGECICHETS